MLSSLMLCISAKAGPFEVNVIGNELPVDWGQKYTSIVVVAGRKAIAGFSGDIPIFLRGHVLF